MIAFLMAGFEITSTALAWSIHLLSKHPRVQQKLKAEVTGGLVSQDLSMDRLDSFVYLDCVIKVVLRFSPPGDVVLRTLTVDGRPPNSGAQLFKGDQIVIPIHTLARDSQHWSISPDLFDPERFLGKDKYHHPYAFIPFDGGRRQCIGQDLSRFELKVIIARLIQHVTFGDGGPVVNAGDHLTRLTIMPKYVGVTIEFN
ncbi:unnamed protein product [Rotaria sordida]|uniref:Cytochrome P450 n=1 Tax=Rotaria sordida TaxID=392033 RepID=A0A816BNY6_9BILA|nr:unnamed protein product [Rotaria sordida]CAF1612969.1 unnamed protein product [Rotaria sordida]